MREASLEAIDAEFSAAGQAARGRNPRPTREQFLRRRVQQEMASEWARHAGHEGPDAEDPILEEDEDGSPGP
ncbi:hypothetical protein AMAG_05372 [Allomyces macrogynus ATCC 38327]|uniref:Uncharacterized protein n=1 Tax=Allomyces macrogynus (strain ATCC 38327) TaxID=578462 RepID=A0A0L0SBI6_ALLM3|nr:hypothetical protein AMAG_05372 [Allomyces macrogynus ATCC 38327]|eukprot:KNE59923.1 hypothetical protein AMAG_05372 [Allomyces macrogynus ATCC 38327]